MRDQWPWGWQTTITSAFSLWVGFIWMVLIFSPRLSAKRIREWTLLNGYDSRFISWWLFFFLQSMKCSQRSNVERWNWKTARRLTVRQHPKSVIKILDKTRTQSWYYLEHYQERPKAFGKAIPDQKGSNLWVARSLISCKWAAFSRSNCMFSYILLYASL